MNRDAKTLVILAGGKSRRMGRDKTFLPYQGTTFLEHLIHRGQQQFDQILVAAGSREHSEFVRKGLGEHCGITVIEDRYDSIGPMGGLLSVFEQTRVKRFVTIAVDIPEADMQVLRMLFEELRDPLAAVMFSFEKGRVESCAAAYGWNAYRQMKAACERGEFALRKALAPEGIRVLDMQLMKALCPSISLEHLRHSFQNINTSEEFQQLRQFQQSQQSIRTAPEILAPAGTEAAARAAVNAGCDAVYLGGQLYGARAYAGNFDQDTLLRTLDACHLFGVRVYMTVNTLLKEREIDQLVPYMESFYQAGLDGVIVQDVGALRVLREAYPDLPLHGSTQMSIASSYGAEFLRSQGLTRVVPARELTLQEIAEIRKQVDIEIETFVHGAMCYAYSGKCLFSSFYGGRSGNRGRCAQPCRQLYDMGEGIREYSLSMKDLCTLPILPRLIDAGIDSFKIEGRMKNPSYVAATVQAYRQARDFTRKLYDEHPEQTTWEGLSKTAQKVYLKEAYRLSEELQDIYNRGGFCTGYYNPGEFRPPLLADPLPNAEDPIRRRASSDRPMGGKADVTHAVRRKDWRSEKNLEMISRGRPNHDGLLVGQVEVVQGPEVFVRLTRDVSSQDVLEIRPGEIELTSPDHGKKGELLPLKGRELRRIKPGMPVYRTRNHALLQRIERDILQRERTVPGKAVVYVRIGEPLRITISNGAVSDPVCITVEGDAVEAATGRPTSAEVLIEKMKKTGGTHVELDVVCELDEQAFVPMSRLNDLRRSAVEAYKEAICRRYYRDET